MPRLGPGTDAKGAWLNKIHLRVHLAVHILYCWCECDDTRTRVASCTVG